MPTATAVASLQPGPVDAPESFVELRVDVPDPGPHDLLVEVRAVSVNPVDVKLRATFDAAEGPRVFGYDAAGVVRAVGAEVSRFAVGDRVYYAGSIDRPGSNATLQLVDERIVGPMPRTLGFADAAALPLTAITAWESLFDRLGLTADSSGIMLVVGGAGGVGSIMIQLLRARTAVTVVATGGREESTRFAREMGAHHVVDRDDLVARVREVAPDGVQWIFSPFSADNLAAYVDLLTPGGAVVAIDDPDELDVTSLKPKSLSWHWEFMFTRPLHTPDDDYQHRLLAHLAELVDAGRVRSTATSALSPFTVDTVREAHRRVESSGTVGKIVIER